MLESYSWIERPCYYRYKIIDSGCRIARTGYERFRARRFWIRRFDQKIKNTKVSIHDFYDPTISNSWSKRIRVKLKKMSLFMPTNQNASSYTKPAESMLFPAAFSSYTANSKETLASRSALS